MSAENPGCGIVSPVLDRGSFPVGVDAAVSSPEIVSAEVLIPPLLELKGVCREDLHPLILKIYEDGLFLYSEVPPARVHLIIGRLMKDYLKNIAGVSYLAAAWEEVPTTPPPLLSSETVGAAQEDLGYMQSAIKELIEGEPAAFASIIKELIALHLLEEAHTQKKTDFTSLHVYTGLLLQLAGEKIDLLKLATGELYFKPISDNEVTQARQDCLDIASAGKEILRNLWALKATPLAFLKCEQLVQVVRWYIEINMPTPEIGSLLLDICDAIDTEGLMNKLVAIPTKERRQVETLIIVLATATRNLRDGLTADFMFSILGPVYGKATSQTEAGGIVRPSAMELLLNIFLQLQPCFSRGRKMGSSSLSPFPA